MGVIAGFEHCIRENEPLAPYTWLRLGGPAQFYAEPTSLEELQAIVKSCRAHDVSRTFAGWWFQSVNTQSGRGGHGDQYRRSSLLRNTHLG